MKHDWGCYYRAVFVFNCVVEIGTDVTFVSSDVICNEEIEFLSETVYKNRDTAFL